MHLAAFFGKELYKILGTAQQIATNKTIILSLLAVYVIKHYN